MRVEVWKCDHCAALAEGSDVPEGWRIDFTTGVPLCSWCVYLGDSHDKKCRHYAPKQWREDGPAWNLVVVPDPCPVWAEEFPNMPEYGYHRCAKVVDHPEGLHKCICGWEWRTLCVTCLYDDIHLSYSCPKHRNDSIDKRYREELARELARERNHHDHVIAAKLRMLTGMGVTRKTVKIEELRKIVHTPKCIEWDHLSIECIEGE